MKSLYHRSALLQMNKRMNEEKSALPMTRGQIENFIIRNGKTYFTALFTTSQLILRLNPGVYWVTCNLGKSV